MKFTIEDALEAFERIKERTSPDPDTRCWIWPGSHTFRKGKNDYGVISVRGRKERVHRVAFVAWHGPIPDGLEIDHLCNQTLCCNPLHLEAVTREENIRRHHAHRAKHSQKPPAPINHGTNGGYFTHRYRGEQACIPCRKAHAAYDLQRRNSRATV